MIAERHRPGDPPAGRGQISEEPLRARDSGHGEHGRLGRDGRGPAPQSMRTAQCAVDPEDGAATRR
jgi:hypothetical protein